jgi:hypothetical protein
MDGQLFDFRILIIGSFLRLLRRMLLHIAKHHLQLSDANIKSVCNLIVGKTSNRYNNNQ